MHAKIGKFEIKYQDRKWHALNGRHTATFPPGPSGKLAAKKHAISISFPQLYVLANHIINKRPLLASRTWKAVQLVIDSKIKINNAPRNGGLIGWVVGAGNTYSIVHYGENRLGCSCYDCMNHTAPEINYTHHCKHIIAYKLFKKLEKVA